MQKSLTKSRILKALSSLLLLFAVALAFTWFLELCYYLGDFGRATNFIFANFRVFLFNAWFMFLILLIIAGLSGSIFRASGITLALILIISYIHINKFRARGTPLLPEDFQLAAEVASLSKFVSIISLVRLVLSVLFALFMGELTERLLGKFFISSRLASQQQEASFSARHLIIPRVSTLALALIFLFSGASLIAGYQASGSRADFLGTSFIAWNQTENYDQNGFILGFLYNCGKFKVQTPADYSEATIAELKEHYEKISAMSSAEELNEADYNIIVILDESFIDPAIIEAYYPHSGGDITPVLHQLMQKYPSGYLFSTDYGGGTANIEFEALTGLSNYWTGTTPYTSLISHLSSLPSLASFAKGSGYTTTAIHSFNGSMYKRNFVLAKEGFDTFIDINDFQYRDHEGSSEFINDRSIFSEVSDLLDRDGKQFIFAITMQNHAGYDPGSYEHYQFTLAAAPSGDAERKSQIEIYFETLHHADTYLGEFIANLEQSEEKSVVLFFGDHAPGLFRELNSSADPAEFALSRRTPYFIYTNFDLPAGKAQLPTTTPNCLSNTLLTTLDVKKPALGYLLDEVCAAHPILTPLYFAGEEPALAGSLKAYQLVIYDLLSGKQYWIKE